MPAKKVVKVNHFAAGHAQELKLVGDRVYDAIMHNLPVSRVDLDSAIKSAQEVMRVLKLDRVEDTSDPFLTDGPRPAAIEKMPTVTTPVVKPEPEKQKSGFLGIKG
jgi:hypothetical protein